MNIRHAARMLGILLVLVSAPSLAHASLIVHVTVDTTALATDPGALSGPFAVFFQLTDGNGSGDGNNTVSLTNFVFGTGASIPGTSTSFGGVTGDLDTSVSMTDSGFFTMFSQGFTPGSVMSFRITMTTNVDSGGTPDAFAFSLLDSTGFAIATLDPSLADTFLTITIDSPNPGVSTYASDPTRTIIAIAAPQAMSSAPAVPEPATMSLVCLGLFPCVGRLFGITVSRR